MPSRRAAHDAARPHLPWRLSEPRTAAGRDRRWRRTAAAASAAELPVVGQRPTPSHRAGWDGVGLLDLRFLPLIQAVSYGHVYPVTSCHSPYGDW